jgi:hypothetical protein
LRGPAMIPHFSSRIAADLACGQPPDMGSMVVPLHAAVRIWIVCTSAIGEVTSDVALAWSLFDVCGARNRKA